MVRNESDLQNRREKKRERKKNDNKNERKTAFAQSSFLRCLILHVLIFSVTLRLLELPRDPAGVRLIANVIFPTGGALEAPGEGFQGSRDGQDQHLQEPPRHAQQAVEVQEEGLDGAVLEGDERVPPHRAEGDVLRIPGHRPFGQARRRRLEASHDGAAVAQVRQQEARTDHEGLESLPRREVDAEGQGVAASIHDHRAYVLKALVQPLPGRDQEHGHDLEEGPEYVYYLNPARTRTARDPSPQRHLFLDRLRAGLLRPPEHVRSAKPRQPRVGHRSVSEAVVPLTRGQPRVSQTIS